MKQYVLGFAFNSDLTRVVAIRKRDNHRIHPGLWNGLGGRVEPGEGFRHAMVKAFQRETGVFTGSDQWFGFHNYQYRHGITIRCFTARLSDEAIDMVISATDEQVRVWEYVRALRTACGLTTLLDDTFVPDVSYLLPMAHLHLRTPPADWNIG